MVQMHNPKAVSLQTGVILLPLVPS